MNLANPSPDQISDLDWANWLEVRATISEAWPSSDALAWSTGTQVMAVRLLRPFSIEHVAAAVMALALEGDRFPPPPGVIAKKASELSQSGTTWAEVWHEVMRQVRTYGAARYDEIPWAATEIWHFVDHVGYPAFEALCRCNEADLATLEAQWRNKWQSWRARAVQDRSYGAISGSDLPRLAEAATRRPGGLQALTAGLAKSLPPALPPPARPKGDG